MGVDRLPAGVGSVLEKVLAARSRQGGGRCCGSSAHLRRVGRRRGSRCSVSPPPRRPSGRSRGGKPPQHLGHRRPVPCHHAVGGYLGRPEYKSRSARKAVHPRGFGCGALDRCAWTHFATLRQIDALPVEAVCSPDDFKETHSSVNSYPRPGDLFDAPAGIAYTSGTTGRTQGCRPLPPKPSPPWSCSGGGARRYDSARLRPR